MRRGLIALLLAASMSVATAADWHFSIIGDTPYTDAERKLLPAMLAQIAERQPAFILHAGDIKSGGQRCDDAMYHDRRALFDAVTVPLIYTPGDNEWTDCHRASNGAYDPVERLAFLRQVFFAQPRSLGTPSMAVERQSDAAPAAPYPENLRWARDGVVFATLNVTGSNNNFGKADAPSHEYRQRHSANLAWMADAFARAEASDARLIVLAMQGDPHFKAYAAGKPPPGFADFLDRLRAHVLATERPVILIHGDSHMHKIDHPLKDMQGQAIERFTRIETYGAPFMGWVEVRLSNDATVHIRSHPWAPPPNAP
ncbi:MAG: metallophosphoesterase [Rhodocyclaceae bacterium]